ncbi:uncharacterized protein LOC134180085 [Corticium candelabrum]|uniref:uncharacterized protein LOC134180085 n=1 Tax=Corticium candelabrum TaxID=121492 RepID=UPI002E25A95D|nr:uncharacterized protein LOC134180085 [Corticium candelabrum]
MGDKRKIEFYVNDCSQAIIARDILLLTLASQAPQKTKSLNHFLDLFCNIYANLSLDECAGHKLDHLLDHLLNNFPAVDGFMHIPTVEHLWHIKKNWALWKTKTTSLEEALQLRNTQARTYFIGKYLNYHSITDEQLVMPELLQNRDLAATETMQEELLHYYQTGNMLERDRQGRSVLKNAKLNTCNWTLFDPELKQFPTSTSQPFQFLISGSEATDYQADDQTLLATLKSAYRRLIKTFAADTNNSKLQITFDVGDCNSFLSQRIPFNITFDVIDTSNLADYLDPVSLLLFASPRLNRLEPHATLWVEFLKSQSDYSNCKQLINKSLGFSYSLLNTCLKLQCFLPIESSLLVDEYSKFCGGSIFRSNMVTGIALKFKSTPYPIGLSPTALQLMPNPSDCVFRQMIDTYLMSVYDIYTGCFFQELRDNFFFKSIPNLLRLLCSVAQTLDNPRELFDYLYDKVKKCETTANVYGTRSLDVFAFDVQVSSLCLCPPEYQPTKPLHPYFANSCNLETLICDVKPTLAGVTDCCPVVGWIMIENMTTEKFSISQEMTVFPWIKHNSNHLQFIDSIQILIRDLQVEISVPAILGPNACAKNVVFVALSLRSGLLLYKPLQTSVPKPQQQLTLTQRRQKSMLSVQKTSCAKNQEAVEVSVSSLFESKKSFRVQVKLQTRIESCSRSNVAVRASCDEKNHLAVNLHIQIKTEETTPRSFKTMVWLPAFIDTSHDCKAWIDDEQHIVVILKKSALSIKAQREKLNLDSLYEWPVNRPLGVPSSMFTPEEITAFMVHELPFGQDKYLDVRRHINIMFTTLLDHDAYKQGVVKLSQLRNYFVSLSSPETVLLAHMPKLRITSGGVPVIVLDYLVAHNPLTSYAKQFLSYMNVSNNVHISIPTSLSSIEFLIQLLETNSQLLLHETPEYVQIDIHLQRSFLVPLYPQGPLAFGNMPMLFGQFMKYFQQIFNDEKGHRGSPQMAKSRSSNCCSLCLSSTPNLKRCSRCHITLYCSTECQKKDWKDHKKHCTPSK